MRGREKRRRGKQEWRGREGSSERVSEETGKRNETEREKL